MDYRGYNDYKVEVYSDSRLLGTFLYVSNIWWLSIWLNINPRYRKWTYISVIHRLTDTPIGQYSREGAIPAKPRI